MSVTYTLSDGSTTISLYPKWDYKARKKMDRADHRMYDASLYSYRFSSFDLFEFSLEGISPAVADVINDWWEAKTSLTFTITRDGTASAKTVKISGNRTPFPKFVFPRVDYYRGKMELEATTA